MPDQSSIPLEATVLTIELDNAKPVELIDLTNSFLNLGEEYKRFVAAHPEFGESPFALLMVIFRAFGAFSLQHTLYALQGDIDREWRSRRKSTREC